MLGDMRLAVEAKASARIASHHLRGLHSVADEQSRAGRRIVVCLEPRARRTDDGIDILPAPVFAQRLWSGDSVLPEPAQAMSCRLVPPCSMASR